MILFTSMFQIVNAMNLSSFGDDFEKYYVDSFPSSGGWELWFDGAGAERQVIVNNVSHSCREFIDASRFRLLGRFCSKTVHIEFPYNWI